MRAAMLVLALALCSCSREASFDEQFSRSENEIEQRALELEEQLDNGNQLNETNGAFEGQSD